MKSNQQAIPIAECIGTIDEIITETERAMDHNKMPPFLGNYRVSRLRAAKASLVWCLNNRDACVAFMEAKGKQDE